MKNGIVILDFGSQYTQLIARRVRELGVFSELLPFQTSLAEIAAKEPKGIVLSGGPNSVWAAEAPRRADLKELEKIAPLLGICYGMQLMTQEEGGRVESAQHREYGLMPVTWSQPLATLPREQKVWMSHGDVVKVPPPQFEIVARSEQGHPAAMISSRSWALQFHPEVTHTEMGTELLKAFVFGHCNAEPNWSQSTIADALCEQVRAQVKNDAKVLCALSGGVDSTVLGMLVTKALGKHRVTCVFVDTGLLRKDEYEEVHEIYKAVGLNIHGLRAEDEFLENLRGVSDPEQKRKIIGRTFIDVFKKSMRDLGEFEYLAQGTLYPDVIESVSPRGTSVTIKSHHNVGGLPENLNLKLVEPLRELFKDEVRVLGRQLGIPEQILGRHPFPGPGLAVRVLGEITKSSLQILKEADSIFIAELKTAGLYDQIWQAFAVLLPVRTVGVQGDARTYDQVLCLRAVTSTDGMTADWFGFPSEFLRQVSSKITNRVKGISRVVYDITSKPPGTIEWE